MIINRLTLIMSLLIHREFIICFKIAAKLWICELRHLLTIAVLVLLQQMMLLLKKIASLCHIPQLMILFVVICI
ncbi:hypothetical protein FGO68_gene12987 [Halteria grandinella]|uniref:Uncharacterized protein n=1 Tax=Halteria grandinella TaxID=5974 RepID=A0A8J8NAG7_HALGN|nr:hypothetical protein FGO68_gene12987 [Halteria grandinella]